MRSKHLSVRKCIDKKPDKIKGIVCICIILVVVCAGNMIPNYLISLKAAKIAKTSTTISNADISPYSHSISAEERLTKMMSIRLFCNIGYKQGIIGVDIYNFI